GSSAHARGSRPRSDWSLLPPHPACHITNQALPCPQMEPTREMESSHWDMVHSPADIARYHQLGQWSDAPLSDHVRRARETRPRHPAFFTDSSHVSWAHYDDMAS